LRIDNLIVKTPFTKEMKATHTILIPQMLPIHFDFLAKVFRQAGYKMEVLKTSHATITEEGLRSVHNDTCYPALLVIGQFIDALKSGKYDLSRTALMITQTGGGCRASNYIYLLRKALEKNGFDNIPVVSLNFSGLEKNSGFVIGRKTLIKAVFSLVYADFLMCLYNQCVPYELQKGDTQAVVEKWTQELLNQMESPLFVRVGHNYKNMLADFAAIPMDRDRETVKVGIVGEIYVKYAPLGNNYLEDYLVSEGAEVVNSGLLDFCLYCVYNSLFDREIYGKGGLRYHIMKIVARYMERKQRQMTKEIVRHGLFTPPADFSRVVEKSQGYLDHGVKMGEGWLLTAEMLELIHSGVNNIVSAQPFGCLPNHIVAKGMIRKIKDNYPLANITAIDYDPGASRINQENRLKLMLANARLAGGIDPLSYTQEEGVEVEVLA
jgi:predicted nucleotide-binding protein (sugar kinase/HSP70/actin superfamily)